MCAQLRDQLLNFQTTTSPHARCFCFVHRKRMVRKRIKKKIASQQKRIKKQKKTRKKRQKKQQKMEIKRKMNLKLRKRGTDKVRNRCLHEYNFYKIINSW